MKIPRGVARTEAVANLDLQTRVIVACALLVLCLHTASKVRDRTFQNFFIFAYSLVSEKFSQLKVKIYRLLIVSSMNISRIAVVLNKTSSS